MIDAGVQITYRTFRKHLGKQLLQWAAEHGYDRYLPLSKDWHVTYYRGVYAGRRCLYLCWSAIEFIWVQHAEHGQT